MPRRTPPSPLRPTLCLVRAPTPPCLNVRAAIEMTQKASPWAARWWLSRRNQRAQHSGLESGRAFKRRQIAAAMARRRPEGLSRSPLTDKRNQQVSTEPPVHPLNRTPQCPDAASIPAPSIQLNSLTTGQLCRSRRRSGPPIRSRPPHLSTDQATNIQSRTAQSTFDRAE